jgi:uncharacterized protein YndB with AHSA1/START domain
VAANSLDLEQDPRAIVGTRMFDAPRELVWKAWTDPKHLAQWWGPDGFTTTTDSFDMREGGVWRRTRARDQGIWRRQWASLKPWRGSPNI